MGKGDGGIGKIGRIGAGVATGGLSEIAYYGPRDAQRQAAEAAQGAAMAQSRTAREQQAQMRADINKYTEGVTVEGLAQFDKALALQDKNISRQEQLLANIDPAILEASQQALRLLRGEKSSTLAPLQNQRAQQRQKLVNTLRAQLGPGAETSSAGQQALSRFDAETDTLFAGAQQQALSNLGGIAGQFNSMRPDLQGSAMGLGQLAQGRAGLRYNQASLLTGAMQGVNQNVLQSAGAQFTGDALRAQGRSATYAGIANLAGQLGGAAIGAGAGGGFGGASKATPSSYGSPSGQGISGNDWYMQNAGGR